MDRTTFNGIVTDYLGRTDLASQILLFQDIALKKIERKYTFKYMKARTPLSLVAGTYYYAIPSNYNRPLWFKWLDGTEYSNIKQMDANDAIKLNPDLTNDTGEPETYSLNVDPADDTLKILIRPTPNVNYTAEFAYAKYTTLSDTHFFITDAWEVLLYATCLEAMPFMKNDKRLMVWAAMLKDALTDLRKSEFALETGDGDNSLTPAYNVRS